MKNISKTTSYRSPYLWLLAFLLSMSMLSSRVNAQVSSLSFSNTSGSWSSNVITSGGGATLITASTSSTDDDNNYTAVSIGFTFNYAGSSYTTVGASANGYVKLGGSTGTYYGGPFAGSANPYISLMGYDLQGAGIAPSSSSLGSNIYYQTLGTTPNRVFVIQYNNWSWYSYSTSNIFSAQIRLYETSGNVQIMYGPTTIASSYSAQVGINGATTSDYSIVTNPTSWAAATASSSGGTSSTVTCSSTNKPDSGRTYTWANLPMVIDSVTTVQVTGNAQLGATNQAVVALVYYTRGSISPKIVSSLTFNTTGTTSTSNISNAKVQYTKNSSTYSAGAVYNQFGSTVASPSGSFVVTGIDTLVPGANYFFLTYDITSSASALGTVIDAQCTNATDSNYVNSRTPIVTNPAGSRTIIAPMSGNYTINPSVATGGTNYASFAAALTDLASLGISAPVNFAVSAGTYAGLISITGTIPGASATKRVTFDGGTGNAATRIISSSNCSGPALIISSNYVTVRNLTITNSCSTGGQAVGVVSTGAGIGVGININNCIISIPNGNNSYASYGVTTTNAASGYGSNTNAVDSLTLDSNVISGAYYCVYYYGSSTTAGTFGFNRNFKIRNNSIVNFGYYGLYVYYLQSGMDILNNTITGNATSYYGMYLYYCSNHTATNAPHRINGNIISNINYNFLYYLSATATNPTQLFNNMMFNFKASTGYGLYIYAATGYAAEFQAYHNTINLNNATGGYGIYYYNSVTTTNTYFKNNIFTAAAAGVYPVYFSTSPPTSTVNYNVYYNSGGSSAYLGYRGGSWTNASATTSSFTSTTLGDTSWNAAPTFVNSNTNVRITDACGAKAGAAYILATVPTDIDGTTRTVPFVGAHEPSSLSNDMSTTVIISPVAPVNTGTATVSVRFKNVGSAPVYSFTANYSLNGASAVSQTWSGTLAPCADTAITFTTTCTLVGTNNFKFYSSNPNSSADLNRNNDTIATTLLAAMAGGTYTINPAGSGGTNFTSFGKADTALMAGINGPIVFIVSAATYNEQVVIPNAPGSSAINTVTFEGGNGNAATRIISQNNAAGTTLIMNGSKYTKIRNLTITNLSATGGQAVGVVGSGANTAVGNTISNCIISLPFGNSSYTSYGITTTSSASGYGSTTNSVDSLTMDSNTISGAYYGVYLYGNSTTAGTFGYNRNFKFRSNTINNPGYFGMYLYYFQSGIDIINNTFNAGSTGYYGLYSFYVYNHSATNAPNRILANKMNGFAYTFYMYNWSATSTNPTQVYNNMVYNTKSGTTNYGMYYYGGTGYAGEVQVYHNSFNVNGASGGYGLYYYNSSSTTNSYFKNNIFGAAASTVYPAYFSTNPPTGTVNYNIYFNTAGSTANLGYRAGAYTNSSTAATMFTSTSLGDSSQTSIPSFINATTNLRVTSPCTPRAFNTGATSVTGITTDIDGNTRASNPQIGCSEVIAYTNDMSTVAIYSPSYPISLGTQTVTAKFQNFGSGSVSFFTMAYKVNSASPVTQVVVPSSALNTCDTVVATFTTTFSLAAQSTLKVYSANPGGSADNNTLNDTIITSIAPPMSGTYVIGTATSDFTTFGAAMTALQTLGVGGPVTFNVKSATYNEYLDFSTATIIGLSATNTITFKSLVGIADSVVLSPSANAFVIKYQNTSYVSFKNMTINQPTNGSNGIVFGGSTSSFDTIYNCKITLPIGSSTSYIITTNGAYVNNLVFRKNILTGGYYALYFYNTSAPYVGKNCIIDSNTIQNNYSSQIYCYYNSVNFKFRNNTININGTGGSGFIYVYFPDSSYEFSNNTLNVASTISSVSMYLTYYAAGNAAQHGMVFNNRLLLASNSTSIYAYNYFSTYCDFFNNDFNLGAGYMYWSGNSYNRFYNNTIASNSGSYTMYLYTGYTGTELRNNILSNTGGATPLTLSGTLGATEMLDYNLYYSTGTNQVSSYTMPAWKSLAANIAVGRDRNSLSYRPPFNSAIDLTPNASDSAVWAINGRAQLLPIVTGSLNGVSRPANVAAGVPDIGAYEVTPSGSTLPPYATATPATPVAGTSQYFFLGGDTLARVDWAALSTVPSALGLRHYPGTIAPQLGTLTASSYIMNAYWDFGNPGNTYSYTMTMYYKKPWIGTNVNLTNGEANMTPIHKILNSTNWISGVIGGSPSVDTTNTWLISAASQNNFGVFTGTNNSTPVPVVMTNFSADRTGNDAFLTWTTASEINSSIFVVERSINGSSYTTVGKVKASGNSNDVKSYNFVDGNISELFKQTNTIYYRLKMVDMDASFAYSTVATINGKAKVESGLTVSPNPFTSDINLTMNSTISGNAVVEIADVQGKVISTRTVIVSNGQVSLTDLSSANSGIYFVNLKMNGETMHAKVIKN